MACGFAVPNDHTFLDERRFVAEGPAEGIDAITKFAEAIKGYPLGMQIILVGVLLEVIASFWGGVGMLAGK